MAKKSFIQPVYLENILKWMLKMKNLYAVSTSMDTAGKGPSASKVTRYKHVPMVGDAMRGQRALVGIRLIVLMALIVLTSIAVICIQVWTLKQF